MDIVDTITSQTLRHYPGYTLIPIGYQGRKYLFLDTPDGGCGMITITKPDVHHHEHYDINVTIGDKGGDITQMTHYGLNNPSIKLFVNTLKHAAHIITHQ